MPWVMSKQLINTNVFCFFSYFILYQTSFVQVNETKEAFCCQTVPGKDQSSYLVIFKLRKLMILMLVMF